MSEARDGFVKAKLSKVSPARVVALRDRNPRQVKARTRRPDARQLVRSS